MLIETRCCQKKKKSVNFEYTRHKISVPLAMTTKVVPGKLLINFETFENPKNIIPGKMLGQDRPEKNSVNC